MPAPSKAMQMASAIALDHPEKLKARNRSLLKMSKEQLHEFASTPRKGLPEHVPQQTTMKAFGKRKPKKKARRP